MLTAALFEQARHDLEKIDTRMRQLVDTNAEMKAYRTVLDEIANELARDEPVVRGDPDCNSKLVVTFPYTGKGCTTI